MCPFFLCSPLHSVSELDHCNTAEHSGVDAGEIFGVSLVVSIATEQPYVSPIKASEEPFASLLRGQGRGITLHQYLPKVHHTSSGRPTILQNRYLSQKGAE